MFKEVKRWVLALGFLWNNRGMVWRVMNRTDELRELRYEMDQCEECGGEADEMCEMHEEELERIGGIQQT